VRDCELCTPADVVFENELAYVRTDSNALSRGHMLVVPKRHVANFFDMNAEEQEAVLRLLNQARRFVEERHLCTSFRATRAMWPIRGAASAVF
jgi:diadenosine tetraphosphate (Ap4A) HIT family hydrolase